jgi:putative ABC transport system permease protein
MRSIVLSWSESFVRDLRLALRSLKRSPGFALAVSLTLALCIGANTTIVSVLYGLILKPLPFHDAGQLVEIHNVRAKVGQPKVMTSVSQYAIYRADADLLENVALWRAWTFNIEEDSDPERGIGARVTADYFRLLRVQPLHGRFFTDEESVPGNDRVLVLTQTYWENRYQADPSIVGQVIRLTGEPFTIIGVAPKSVEAMNVDAIMFKPFEWAPQHASPNAHGATAAVMYGRVKTGVSHAMALAQLDTLEQRFMANTAPPGLHDFLTRSGHRVMLDTVRAVQTKSVRRALLLLQGGAFLVLLLGCLNVANLLLARANARQGELAVRQALGASRRAIASQLLAEGLVLAFIGAAGGVGLAWASLRVINRYTTAIVREVQPITIDPTVLLVTAVVAFGVAAFIALLPVLRTWRTNLLPTIQSGGRGSRGAGTRRTSSALVTTQVALALVLLVGAGLLLRSFANLMAVDPGFAADQIVHGRVAFNASYRTPESRWAVQQQIMERMREIPGVQSASYSSHMPVSLQMAIGTFPIRSSVLGQEDTYPTGIWLGVSPNFFDTMGIRIVEGRAFTADDLRPDAPRVFIVDRRFAEKHFPGRSALDELLGTAQMDLATAPRIVGVAEVARLHFEEERHDVPFVYAPLGIGAGGFSIEVRTQLPFEVIVPLMRAQLRSVDSTLPLYLVNTLRTNLDHAAANRRGVMSLLIAFAGIATLLAAVGIYGMVAYDVTQRTREIGVRTAIGATRSQIVRLILRQGLQQAILGLLLGIGAALYLSRFMSSLLYEVTAWDPWAYGAVALLLFLVAVVACLLPAWRAARLDPLVALRCE